MGNTSRKYYRELLVTNPVVWDFHTCSDQNVGNKLHLFHVQPCRSQKDTTGDVRNLRDLPRTSWKRKVMKHLEWLHDEKQTALTMDLHVNCQLQLCSRQQSVLKNASYSVSVEKPTKTWRMLFILIPPRPFGLSFSWSHFLRTRTNFQLSRCFLSSSSKHFITANLSCAYLFRVFTQQIMAKRDKRKEFIIGK